MTIERDLRTLAEISEEISRTKFPCSRRSISRWPLAVRLVNGRKLGSLSEALEIADRMIKAAPAIAQSDPAVRRRQHLKAIF